MSTSVTPGGPVGPPSPKLAAFVVAILCAIWGSTWLVIRNGLEDLPPLSGAAMRFALAAVVLFAIGGPLRAREGGRPPRWRHVLTHGVLCTAIPFAIVYEAETVLPSGLVSLIWGVYPLLIAALSTWLLPAEKVKGAQLGGFLAGFAGLVLLFGGDVRNLGEGALGVALLLLLSPFVSAIGTLLIKRDAPGVSSILLNRNGLSVAAVLLSIAAAVLEHDQEFRFSARAIGSVLYLALVGTVTAFSLYFWLLRFARANQLALISYVTPLIALALGWALAGEPIGVTTILGGTLILGGIGLARRAPTREDSA